MFQKWLVGKARRKYWLVAVKGNNNKLNEVMNEHLYSISNFLFVPVTRQRKRRLTIDENSRITFLFCYFYGQKSQKKRRL